MRPAVVCHYLQCILLARLYCSSVHLSSGDQAHFKCWIPLTGCLLLLSVQGSVVGCCSCCTTCAGAWCIRPYGLFTTKPLRLWQFCVMAVLSVQCLSWDDLASLNPKCAAFNGMQSVVPLISTTACLLLRVCPPCGQCVSWADNGWMMAQQQRPLLVVCGCGVFTAASQPTGLPVIWSCQVYAGCMHLASSLVATSALPICFDGLLS